MDEQLDGGDGDPAGQGIAAVGIAAVVARFGRAAQAAIDRDEQLRALLAAHLSPAAHAAAVAAHLQAVLAGTIDPAASRQVGEAHVAVGLAPSAYLSVYHTLFSAIHQVDPAGLPELATLRSRWLADTCTGLDAYHEALLASWARERDQLHADVDRLAAQANTDELTGLLNRRGFLRAVETTRRAGTLVLLDLDNFKALNDRAGHPAGDAVLRAVGAALTRFIRTEDAAGRLGGDEFGVWLPGGRARGVAALVARLRAVLPDQVGVSVGAVHCRAGSRRFAQLHQHADRSLYGAKRRAGGEHR